MELKVISKRFFITNCSGVVFSEELSKMNMQQAVLKQNLIIQANNGYSFVFTFPLMLTNQNEDIDFSFDTLCNFNNFEVLQNSEIVKRIKNKEAEYKINVGFNDNKIVFKEEKENGVLFYGLSK